MKKRLGGLQYPVFMGFRAFSYHYLLSKSSEEEIKQESVHKFQKIENVINIFNNEILAFEIENYEIKVGDILIVKTANGRFFNKPILEIRINDVSYQQKTITNKINIAVKVEPIIKKNQEFFIKKANM